MSHVVKLTVVMSLGLFFYRDNYIDCTFSSDGEAEVGLDTVNGDGGGGGGGGGELVVSTLISTPTSDTSDAANPLLTTTSFLDEK